MRTLKQISKDHPKLTFQNEGYQYINKSKLDDVDLKAIDEISEILKSKLSYFVKFFNFKVREDGSTDVRFDGYYNDRFVGVYYLPIYFLDNTRKLRKAKRTVKS